MKFTCSQTAILKAINTCSKAVAVRTTIPILRGILITIKDGTATLTASNLNMSIETSFDVQNYENGSTVVSAKLIGDIVRKLPNSLINFDNTLEYGKLTINCLGSKFSIVALPAEEFPIIGGLNSKNYVEINKKELRDIINKTVFAASNDEKKGILTGCLFNLAPQYIEAVALDSFKMAICKKETDTNITKSVIIPANILTEINKVLSEDEGSDMVSVLFEEKKIEFLTEDTRIVSRLLEGAFVNYKDIIPKEYITKLTVNKTDLFSSLERASLFTKEGKSNLVKLFIDKNGIEITSNSEEGNVREVVEADIDGSDIVVGFNSRFLIDIIKSISDEEFVIELGGSIKPAVIKPIEGNEFTYLIVPVRVE